MSQSPLKKEIIKKTKQQTIYIDSQSQIIILFGVKYDLIGKLYVTNYRIGFYQDQNIYFDIPLGYLNKCQRSLDQSNCSYVQITLKFGVNIKFKYPQFKFQSSNNANTIISKSIEKGSIFALEYCKDVQQSDLCGRWERQQDKLMEQSQKFQNSNWKVFQLYPQKFTVPIPYIGKRQPNDRLVILSHIHEIKKKIALWRTGPGKADNCQQQWVPKSSHHSHRHLIVEIKHKGIGSSKSLAPKVVELDSLTNLKQSFSKMFLNVYKQNQPQKWIQTVNLTKWFQQIAILITQAEYLSRQMTDHHHVTLLSDNQVRGAQIASLIQIILQPQYRTIKGFNYLIEKQFLQFGSSKPIKKQKQQDKGIAIIQFFDCIYQLQCIFPLSFEFNSEYLVFLAQNVYSNKFGNFLLATKAIQENERQQIFKYASIWKNIEKNIEIYKNSYYVDYKDCDMYELRENISVKNIKLWDIFFNKWFKQTSDQDHIDRHHHLRMQHYKLKKQTQQLRQKINQQHSLIIKKKKQLKQLKQFQ